MLKALIVDDEIASVRTLELLLTQFAKDVEVVDVARSSSEALQKVTLVEPDIVFLDIEMPGGTGFDFLEQCSLRNFDVIFITAFEYYAVKAFKYSAIDYLLKPIEIEELESAIKKVTARKYTNFDGKNRYYALFENLKDIIPTKLVVTLGNKSEYIDLKDVAYFEEAAAGTIVQKINKIGFKIDNDLEDLEEVLDTKNFIRINQTQLVNLSLIRNIKKNGSIELESGNNVVASKEYIADVINQLEVYIKQS